MRSFLLKLNTRQLTIHFMAFWLFTFGFHVLASLYDYHFLYTGFGRASGLSVEQRHEWDINIIGLCSSSGLIIAYIISWQISLRKKWYWANSVIVFVVAFALKNFYLFGWSWLQNIFLKPGRIFGPNTIAYVVTNGVLMLAIGVFFFFWKGIINYIDRGVYRDPKEVVATGKVSLAKKK